MTENKTKTITVLLFPGGGPAEVFELAPGLEPMQNLVGGYIQCISIPTKVGPLDVYCNEEGKLEGLAPNRWVFNRQDYLAGDFFVTKANGRGDSVSLNETDIAAALDYFDQRDM